MGTGDLREAEIFMQTVEGLSALTRLIMGSSEHSDPTTPRCDELASLRSTSLQDLSLEVRKLQGCGWGKDVGYRQTG